MNNLASTYSHLGRHADVLAMRERVLEFYRRVLPEDHPDIGEGHVVEWCWVWIEERDMLGQAWHFTTSASVTR